MHRSEGFGLPYTPVVRLPEAVLACVHLRQRVVIFRHKQPIIDVSFQVIRATLKSNKNKNRSKTQIENATTAEGAPIWAVLGVS